jgi:hypothetical protein
MDDSEATSLGSAFLAGSSEVRFAGQRHEEEKFRRSFYTKAVPELGVLSQTEHQLPTDPAHADPDRRKPRRQGRPGHLRVDTVHQGDRDGVYHINAVDEVTQWDRAGYSADLRALVDAAAGAVAGIVSVHHSRLSFRQRQRVHQLHGYRNVGKAAHRADQIAGFGHIGAPHAEAVNPRQPICTFNAVLSPGLNFWLARNLPI